MKKILSLITLLVFCNILSSYAMVERWTNSDNINPNTWYYAYFKDDFNDDTNDPYMICTTNGTFSNSIETNAESLYLLSFTKYKNNSPSIFTISILEYGYLPFKDYTGMFKASIKYNGEVYEYPFVLYVYDFKDFNHIVISESENSELYHILLYLLTAKIDFKLRLEKYSSLGISYNNSYICEVPATNFSEIYNAIYTNANN